MVLGKLPVQGRSTILHESRARAHACGSSLDVEPEKNATLMPRQFKRNFFPNLISTTFWLYDRV